MKFTISAFLSLVVFLSASILDAEEDWSVAMSAGWDSRYVSEGRDNLEDGGLLSADFAIGNGSWEIGAVFAEGDTVDYTERNWWLAKTLSLGPVELSASYTYLEFPDDASHDSEYAIEMSSLVFSEFAATLATVYSEEADGLFFEASLEREYQWGEHFTFIPYALVAVNSGYVSDEPNGLNNWQTGAIVRRQLGEYGVLEFFANASFGIADGVGDVAWFGLRFSR